LKTTNGSVILVAKVSDILTSLWEEGFFITGKSTKEIENCFNLKGYNLNPNTITMGVRRVKFLTRKGTLWIQKYNYCEHSLSNGSNERNGIDLLKSRGIHPLIIHVSGKLFADGHYSQAIFEAFKIINIKVKEKSGLTDLDGKSLMSQAFKLPTPRLRLNDLISNSDKDEQEGFMLLFMGAIVGILKHTII